MKIEKILLIILYLGLGILVLYLSKSRDDVEAKISQSNEAISHIEYMTNHDINIVSGQDVYVPAYSSIRSLEGKGELKLSINLSVRNTDPDHSIILSYVDFYNTLGKRSKQFLNQPVQIGPMATLDFHITQSDTIGGSGANFYLEWIADTTVYEPVIEAIMLGSAGTQGYSWTSSGLVVRQK